MIIGYAQKTFKTTKENGRKNVRTDNCHQCCGSGMFIQDTLYWFLSIPDPRSNNSTKGRGGKKFFVLPFSVAINIIKLKIIFFLKGKENLCEQNTKNYSTFALKNLSLIRPDHGQDSGRTRLRIPYVSMCDVITLYYSHPVLKFLDIFFNEEETEHPPVPPPLYQNKGLGSRIQGQKGTGSRIRTLTSTILIIRDYLEHGRAWPRAGAGWWARPGWAHSNMNLPRAWPSLASSWRRVVSSSRLSSLFSASRCRSSASFCRRRRSWIFSWLGLLLLIQNLLVTCSAESVYHIFVVFLSSVCRWLNIKLASSTGKQTFKPVFRIGLADPDWESGSKQVKIDPPPQKKREISYLKSLDVLYR